ncbi:SAM-dependent methyltransferase [Desulfobaculum xiamenense]|uniref:SAM-dependent methyltransferase n=1 Tax=Desulfobaculum xiamenense TaxID=995050 RepID=A0A846QE75_9BACT|nr:class I SAM-dependent methyltransferase [Desulfobaculum xiamenense]NJB66591.1 SAM-dependent methyltransferase [Desulfobaculum xiamenense]
MDSEFYSELHPLHADSVSTDLSVPLHAAWDISEHLLEGKTVLEAGCGGMGAQAIQLMSYNPARLVVLDLSENNIRSARSNFESVHGERPNCEFMTFDLCSQDLPREAFDVIHHRGVFQHLPDKNFALDNLYRALKPGGHLLIATYGHGGLLSMISGALRPPFRHVSMRWAQRFLLRCGISPDLVSGILDHLYVPVQTRFTRAEAINMVTSRGFCIVKDVSDLTHEIDTSRCQGGFFSFWAKYVYPNSNRKIGWLSRLLFGTFGNSLVAIKL